MNNNEPKNLTQVLEKRAMTLCSDMEALQAKIRKTSPFNMRPLLEQLGDMQQEFNKIMARLLCS